MSQDYTRRDDRPGCWASLGWFILAVVGVNVAVALLVVIL